MKNIKKNLVFTSAGDNTSFDNLWLDKDRNYDVWVVYYGENEKKYQKYSDKVDYIEKRKGSKFQNFSHIYRTKDLSQYDRFFILDDDIIISTYDINKMFMISEKLKLKICAPSFDLQSKISWRVTIQQPEYYFKYTNWVEVNTPLFTKEALKKLMDVYDDKLIGWGIDYLYIWANGVEEKTSFGIIHNVSCTNPPDSAKGGKRELQKIDGCNNRAKIWEEYRIKNNIPRFKPDKEYGGVKNPSFFDKEFTKNNISKFINIPFDKTIHKSDSDNDKIAFMFLTRNNLIKPELWYKFLNEGRDKCNIYFHTKEKDKIVQKFVKDNQIEKHVHTKWGTSSLVTASNYLIEEALKDETNKYFVLVSETCIPLYTFNYIYKKLFSSNKSYLYTGLTPTRGVKVYEETLDIVYSKISNPEELVDRDTIMRNSQWMILNREHAEISNRYNYEHLFKNFKVADEWYYWNVLNKHDQNFKDNHIADVKPTFFKYDGEKHSNGFNPHPFEWNFKEVLMEVVREISPDSLFVRKISPKNKITYEDLKMVNNTVTIIIPVRNRFDYKIFNLLNSIKNQTYDSSLLETIIVDFGSDEEYSIKYEDLKKDYNVTIKKCKEVKEWSRSKALNIGIKNSKTEYVLISDYDLIFSKNYVEECINNVRKKRNNILWTKFMDSRKGDINHVIKIEDYDVYLKNTDFRSDISKNKNYVTKSILFGRSDFFKEIRGYDENYSIWGVEDDDIIRRFQLNGIELKDLSDKTSFIHQWHPKHQGFDESTINENLKKNTKYFLSNNTIVRNKEKWGEG